MTEEKPETPDGLPDVVYGEIVTRPDSLQACITIDADRTVVLPAAPDSASNVHNYVTCQAAIRRWAAEHGYVVPSYWTYTVELTRQGTGEVAPAIAAPEAEQPGLLAQAEAFIAKLLQDHPGLESVAVVPCFARQSPAAPGGIVRGRKNALLTRPAEVVHMANQLANVWGQQVHGAIVCVQQIDNYMAEQAVTLQGLQESQKRTEEEGGTNAESLTS